jgi:hypothetical protein
MTPLEFTEKHNALYAYLDAYYAVIGEDTVNDRKSLMLKDIERHLNKSFESCDSSLLNTVSELLEINRDTTLVLDEHENLIGFDGICFKKDL